jgi:type VI secretion system protein ImpC
VERAPLRVVLLGDFSHSAEQRREAPLEVSADSFSTVMAELGPELLLEVPNRLTSRPASLVVRLGISAMRDLEPTGLVASVPELQRVQQLIEELEAAGKGKLAPGELAASLAGYADLNGLAEALQLAREALDPPAPAAGSAAAPSPGRGPDDGALDRILSLVDAGGDQPQKDEAAVVVDRLVNRVTGAGRKSRVPRPKSLTRAVQLCRDLLADQLFSIMHHPDFRRLEATWRGLWFLVKRTNFRRGVQLELLDAPRDGLLEALERGVYRPEMEGLSSVAPSLVAVPRAFDNAPGQMELLQALAERCEELQVPLLAGMSFEFFGLEQAAGTTGLPYVGRLLEQTDYTKWRSLRDKDCSRWLALAFNRFLLRAPYKPKDRAALGLRERTGSPQERLWGDPVWAVLSLVTRSHARTGWPTQITGIEDGEVENLPLHSFDGDPSRPMKIPLQAFIPEALARDLAAAGFVALTCAPEGDSAYVFRAPVAHRPEAFTEDRATDTSRAMHTLPYHLLLSRIADALATNRAGLVGGRPPQEAQQALQAFLAGLVADTGHGAGAVVTLGPHPGDADRMLAELQIRTGREVLGGVEVNLAIPL